MAPVAPRASSSIVSGIPMTNATQTDPSDPAMMLVRMPMRTREAVSARGGRPPAVAGRRQRWMDWGRRSRLSRTVNATVGLGRIAMVDHRGSMTRLQNSMPHPP